MMGNRSLLLVGVCMMASLSGCLSVFYPEPTPPPEVRAQCAQIDPRSRGNVYVFAINGLDPIGYDALGSMREYLIQAGFPKVYCGQTYHADWFGELIVKLHNNSSDIRFVLIGYDTGAESARLLAQTVGDKGVPIDLLVYLQPRGLAYALPTSKTPVGKIQTIQTEPLWNKEVSIAKDVETITLQSSGPYGAPRSPITLTYLVEQLTQMAIQTKFEVAPVEAFPPIFEDPAIWPKDIDPKNLNAPPEWDFLKATTTGRIRDSIMPSRDSGLSK